MSFAQLGELGSDRVVFDRAPQRNFQELGVNWFCQEIIRAFAQSLDSCAKTAVSRHHNHRNAWLKVGDGFTDRKPVPLPEIQIGDDSFECLLFELFAGGIEMRHAFDLVALAVQKLKQEVSFNNIILNQ
jgi:hypothetical protein